MPNVEFVSGDGAVAVGVPEAAADAAAPDAEDMVDGSDAASGGDVATLLEASPAGADASDGGDAGNTPSGYCTPSQPSPPDGGVCCPQGITCTGPGCGGHGCIDCYNQCHTQSTICCVQGNKVACAGC